jgi:hypothetical protein
MQPTNREESAVNQITVTIGRGVGDDQLTATQWAEFRAEVRLCLTHYGDVVVSSNGRGEWEGTAEDNYHAVVILHRDLDDLRWSGLLLWAEDWARRYRQNAIAVSRGESVLVTPRAVTR